MRSRRPKPPSPINPLVAHLLALDFQCSSYSTSCYEREYEQDCIRFILLTNFASCWVGGKSKLYRVGSTNMPSVAWLDGAIAGSGNREGERA